MIHKKTQDHVLYDCDYAREMRQILSPSEYDKAGLALGVDLGPMNSHYHKTFDEIFYVLEGSMNCKFYDPESGKTWSEELSSGDVLVVPKGVHHKILEASSKNKLIVMSIPPWHADDVNPSDAI